ncbi:MAG: hypothetical protein HC771_19305 [Synechococcales cyanobacterium CRU_2_2]|nr:hypothetical protein [Synechococcales cyanobacterium CRU_2_2]
MFFADLEQNQITANGTVPGGSTILRHLAAQGESIPSPDGTTPPARLSHSALAQYFQQTHPDADFETALELLLRREVLEIVESTDEPHYKFQVELIRQWFLR